MSAPRTPPGIFRAASTADAPLLQQWMDAFCADVFKDAKNVIKENALEKIQNGDVFVWDDNGIVSAAAKCRPTNNGYVIGFVYTPKKFRTRGYATANVAALCRHILDTGKKVCSLFSDLSNPASNSIYQKIGFKPVCDFNDYSFIYE